MSSGELRQFDPARHGPELSAYVDNELSGAERAEIERLLADSAEARAAVTELREIADALRSLPREPSPIDFAASVRREGLAASESPGPERVWRVPFGLRTLASAAVIAICVGTAWKIMLPPTRSPVDVTVAERIGRPAAPEPDSFAVRAIEPGVALEWAAPPALALEPMTAESRRMETADLALRRNDAIVGDAGDGAADALRGGVARLEEVSGPTGDPTGYVSFDDAGNRVTRFGRVYIPTQNVDQYNNVLYAISAIQRSAGEAPSYVASKPVPTVEEVQLRVPVERAPEVLSTLNNMVVPEQVRVELNVLNDESSYRQLQMLLSQATSQTTANYAFAPSPQSQPALALGALMRPSDGSPLEPAPRTEPAAETGSAAAPAAGQRSKKAEQAESATPGAAAKSAIGKRPGETMDRDAAAEAKRETARPAAGRGRGGAEQPKPQGSGAGEAGGAAGAGGGRGFAGGDGRLAAQSSPAGDGKDMEPQAPAPPARGERVTALITRGQAVWSQLSHSAATIVNRFGEVTQSNRRQMHAGNDLLMFDVTVLPPPQQTTQPAADRSVEAGEKPPSDNPR